MLILNLNLYNANTDYQSVFIHKIKKGEISLYEMDVLYAELSIAISDCELIDGEGYFLTAFVKRCHNQEMPNNSYEINIIAKCMPSDFVDTENLPWRH